MDQNQSRLEWGEIENFPKTWKHKHFVTKIELPEYANFAIGDVSLKIKEKLFKMTENELIENGIKSIDDQVSFIIKNTVEEKSLAKGDSPEKAKNLGQKVKSYYDSLFMTHGFI